jgi:hypothetical protein
VSESRRLPDPALSRPSEERFHGRLEGITDSEQRSLRSIATTAYEAASRTDCILVGLIAIPGLWIFRGVRTATLEQPLIPHALAAGRRLILIESVAWPPGRYESLADGRICCDGTYIGQSSAPFLAAVRQWRATVPDDHKVSAVIIVHGAASADISLLAAADRALAWVRAENAVHEVRRRLAQGPEMTSAGLLEILFQSIDDQP